MKKYLPSVQTLSGFTLIELLVVITIIAILALVGFVAYSGVSARARDSKRMAEIDAIQKAMEKNFQPGNGYVPLQTTDFQNSQVPKDPLTGQNKCGAGAIQQCDYCVVGSVGNFASCAAASAVSTTAPASGYTYIVCANLETNAGVSGKTYYCKSNAQ